MTYQQELIPGTAIKRLCSIDPGKTGYIVMNDVHGQIEAFKTPLDSSGGIDLAGYVEILKQADIVIMEHPPMKVAMGSSVSEESCHCQYMQLYGTLSALCALGLIPEGFYTIRPEVWQDYLELPKKSVVSESIYNAKRDKGLSKQEKNNLKSRAQTMWKGFCADQARQRFPRHKQIPKEAGDSFLLYDVLRKLYAIPDRSTWP